MEGIRYSRFESEGNPVKCLFDRIQHIVLLVKVSKQFKFIHRHQGSLRQMTANAPLNGIRLTLQFVDFFPEFLKALTLVGDMTLHGLLKSPGTLFNLFRMLEQPLKRRCQKH